ncbi:MAG: hypothetical protein GTO49_19700, partial [Anaerolineae bacterium]|nr:hypothetical protein [Anaerolineae bacterium]
SQKAIDFVTEFDGEFLLDSFEESGRVDVGIVFHPTRANNNWQLVFLNGSPRLVAAEDVQDIDVTQDPSYPALAQQQPNLFFWTTEPLLEAIQNLPGGGQRFVVSYPFYKGCHACGVGGYSLLAFDFDAQGVFLGKELLGVSASKPAVPNP